VGKVYLLDVVISSRRGSTRVHHLVLVKLDISAYSPSG